MDPPCSHWSPNVPHEDARAAELQDFVNRVKSEEPEQVTLNGPRVFGRSA